MPTKPRSLAFTVSALADELGVAHETLRRKLRDIGVEVGRGTRISIKQAVLALHSDYEAERTRETRHRANLLALEEREKEQSLVPMPIVRGVLTEVLTPLKTELLSCPATLAGRCNPGDPEMARAALEAWARDLLTSFADGIERTTRTRTQG